jgi:transglutaminase-like putative cysteine protease
MRTGLLIFALGSLLHITSLSAQTAVPAASGTLSSIIATDETDIRSTSPTDALVKRKYTITLLNNKAEGLANFVCYCNKFISLRKFAGEVRDGSGTVIKKIKKSDLQQTAYSEASLADDAYQYYYVYTPPRYPITITYEWEQKRTDGIIIYSSFFPYRDYNQSVEQASYSLQTPEKPLYHVSNMDDCVTQRPLPAGGWITEVKVTNLPPIRVEPYAPAFTDVAPYVRFVPERFTYEKTTGEQGSWAAFAKWDYSLQEGRDVLPPALKEELQRRTAACTTDVEKVQAVYRLLEEKTRYVSIQLGIGGLQTIPAAEVYRTGYGDCKALTNYMKAMLKELGIPSVYTTINLSEETLVETFPSQQFNHVILQVPLPADTLWLECTDPSLPFGYVHSSIAGHHALLTYADGGRFCRLPSYPDSLNTQVNRVNVTLRDDGSAGIQVSTTSRLFQYEAERGIMKREPSKQKDALRGELSLQQAQIGNVRFSEVKAREPELTVSFSAETELYGTRTGKRLFIPLNIMRDNFTVPTVLSERKYDVKVNYGYQDIDSITITLPDSYTVEMMPRPITLTNRFGSFHASAKVNGKTVHITYRLLIRKGTYPRDSYAELRTFRETVRTRYRNQITLKKVE